MELHVHHCYYISGRKPWEYEDALLITLCKKCHETVEGLKRNLSLLMRFEPGYGTLLQIDEIFSSEDWSAFASIINHLYEHPGSLKPLSAFLNSTIPCEPEPENENIVAASN